MLTLENYEEDLRFYDGLIESDRYHARFLCVRGKIRLKMAGKLVDRGSLNLARKNYLLSLRDFNRAIGINPCLDKFYNCRGMAYKKLALYYLRCENSHRAAHYCKRALVSFDKAIELFRPKFDLEERLVKAFLNRGMTFRILAEISDDHHHGDNKSSGCMQPFDKALDALNKAIDVLNSDECRDLFILESKVYLSKAQVRLTSARHVSGDSEKSCIYNGVEDDFSNAVKALEKFQFITPELVNVYFLRSKARLIMGKINERIADFEKIVELVPRYAPARFALGQMYRSSGEYEKAVVSFSEAIRLDAEFSATYYFRGKAKYDLGDYEEAIEDFNIAVKSEPGNSEIYLNRGTAQISLEKFKDAVKDYSKALELNPKSYVAMAGRATAFVRLGNYQKANKGFSDAINLNRNLPEAYHFRGMLNFTQGNIDQSVRDYEKAIHLDSSNGEYYLKRGHSRIRQGKHVDALSDYSRAVELNQNSYMALIHRARLNFVLSTSHSETQEINEKIIGKLKESIADYDRAMELNPDDSRALDGRSDVVRFLRNNNTKDQGIVQVEIQAYIQQLSQKQDFQVNDATVFNRLAQRLSAINAIANKPEPQSELHPASEFAMRKNHILFQNNLLQAVQYV